MVIRMFDHLVLYCVEESKYGLWQVLSNTEGMLAGLCLTSRANHFLAYADTLDVTSIIKSTYSSAVKHLAKNIDLWLLDTTRLKTKIVEDVVNLVYLTEQFVFLPTTKVFKATPLQIEANSSLVSHACENADTESSTESSTTSDSNDNSEENEKDGSDDTGREKDEQGKWKDYEICCNLLRVLEPFLLDSSLMYEMPLFLKVYSLPSGR